MPTEQELSVLLAVAEPGGVLLAVRELGLFPHKVKTYQARLRHKSGRSTLAQMLFWAPVKFVPVRSKLPEPRVAALPDVELRPPNLQKWSFRRSKTPDSR